MHQVKLLLFLILLTQYCWGDFSFLAQGRVSNVEVTSSWSELILNLQKQPSSNEVGVFIDNVVIDPQAGVTSFKVGNRIFLPKTRGNIDYNNFSYQIPDSPPVESRGYELFYTQTGLLYVPIEIADALAARLRDLRYQRVSEILKENKKGYEFTFSPYHQGAKLALAIKLDITLSGKQYSVYEFSKQRGGIERHYDVLNKTSLDQLVLVNGNSRVDKEFYEKSYQGSLKYYQKLKQFPFHAHAIGLKELIGGVDFFENQKEVGFINSNLYLNDAPYFKEYEIFEINGTKVAVTSVVSLETQERLEKYYQSPFKVVDPVMSVRETVQQLQGLADYIILMLPENRTGLDLYNQIYGVDLIITNEKSRADLSNETSFVSRKNKQPIYRKPLASVKTNGFKQVRGEVKIGSDISVRQTSTYLLDNLIYGGFEGYYFYEELSNFKHQDDLLPRASQINPYKLSYSAEDIDKILCDLMLEEYQTDICILTHNDLGFNPPDGLSEVIIRRWFKKRYLVSAILTGEKIQAFVSEQKAQGEMKSFLMHGYSKDMIRGIPIRKEQKYKIITSSELFRKVDKFNSLENFTDKRTSYGEEGSIKSISSFFIEQLKKRSNNSSEEERKILVNKVISSDKDYTRGQWRARVKKIDLNFSQRSSREVDPSFNARDNRVFTNDQVRFQVQADSSVYYQHGLYTAETGEEISFSKERVENTTSTVNNIISDSVFLFSKHSFFWKKNDFGEISPYTQLGYKTQFEKTLSGRQSLWTLDVGMKFEKTKWYDLLQMGPFAEIDYSNENQTPGRYGGGLALRYRLSKPIFNKKLSLDIESDYSYYYRRSNPNLDNVEQLWDSKLSLVTRLFENVNFGPFVQYFYFHSIEGNTSGGFFTTGVQFLYRGDWTL